MARGCGRSHRRTEVSASASGRRRAFGTVVLVWMLSACTAGPDPGPFEITPVVDADQGELVTLLTSGDVDEDVVEFGLSGAAPLPDGTVLVSYDLDAQSAGDDTPPRPRLAILGHGGALTPIDLPVLAGAAVDRSASLLATAPDGTIYLWDREPNRVVARDPGGQWRVLPVDLVQHAVAGQGFRTA